MPLFDFALHDVQVTIRRTPIKTPVRTSFGTMTDRPSVFVILTDDQGKHGIGEIWCNFPSVAAEHRARLAREIVGPALLELMPLVDNQPFLKLMEHFHILALQSGEWGPLWQVCSGFDAALYDLAARRRDIPLYKLISDNEASPKISVYASGIGPETPADIAEKARRDGHRAFKVKLGFGQERDIRSLMAMRQSIGADLQLMADANQRWTLQEAVSLTDAFSKFELLWLEEPLAADRPLHEWQQLAGQSPIPIAGGENINDFNVLERMMAMDVLSFVQPDVAKWGGMSGCMKIADYAKQYGKTYCPHFLGAGVGLLASAHILAAQNSDGLLEMDINPNPLRDKLVRDLLNVRDGKVQLCERPGIGLSADQILD